MSSKCSQFFYNINVYLCTRKDDEGDDDCEVDVFG